MLLGSSPFFNTEHICRTAFAEPFSLLCRLNGIAKGGQGTNGYPVVRDRLNAPVVGTDVKGGAKGIPGPPPLIRMPEIQAKICLKSKSLDEEKRFSPVMDDDFIDCEKLSTKSLSPPILPVFGGSDHFKYAYAKQPMSPLAACKPRESPPALQEAVLHVNRRKSTVKPVRVDSLSALPPPPVSVIRRSPPASQKPNYTIKTEPLDPKDRPSPKSGSPLDSKKDRTPAKFLPKHIQDMLYEELHKYGPYQSSNYSHLREMTGLYGREITTWFDSRRRSFRTRGLIPDDVDRGGYSTEKANTAFLDAYHRGECLCIGKGCFMELKKNRKE